MLTREQLYMGQKMLRKLEILEDRLKKVEFFMSNISKVEVRWVPKKYDYPDYKDEAVVSLEEYLCVLQYFKTVIEDEIAVVKDNFNNL